MAQSSVVDGDVVRDDHAIAVMRAPMWKVARVLQEVGVCLGEFDARRTRGRACAYGLQHLDGVHAADRDEVEPVVVVARAHDVYV